MNSKAETKFNKLKSQAKTKIAALNKEVEQLRGGKGEESAFNVSTLVRPPLRLFGMYCIYSCMCNVSS